MGGVLTSSTFWSAILSLIATVLAQKAGVDVPTSVAVVAPIAVGVKEAARRYGESIAAAAMHNARATVDVARIEAEKWNVPPLRPSAPVEDLSKTAQTAAAVVQRAHDLRERDRERERQLVRDLEDRSG